MALTPTAKERLTIGEVEVLSLSDCIDRIDVYGMFPHEGRDAWDAYRDYVDLDGFAREPSNFASFLISTPSHRVLVDTGAGSEPFGPWGHLKGGLLDEMRRRGLQPEDVDIVFATHMHYDHIGWLVTMRGSKPERTFPNARYLLPRLDWEALFDPTTASARRPNDVSQEALEAFALSKGAADRLRGIDIELVQGDHTITDEIATVATPGHTPGHLSLLISSKGERLFVLGDVVHLPVQLDVPERIVGFDVHPKLGRDTRVDTVAWLEREGLMVAAVHFPAPGFGRVLRGSARRYWHAL